jgi:hypothetical protein
MSTEYTRISDARKIFAFRFPVLFANKNSAKRIPWAIAAKKTAFQIVRAEVIVIENNFGSNERHRH